MFIRNAKKNFEIYFFGKLTVHTRNFLAKELIYVNFKINFQCERGLWILTVW